jgi:hypothetical protein
VTRKPTIYEALRDKLGREPTQAEIKADVARILGWDSCVGCGEPRTMHCASCVARCKAARSAT